ncbi:MAG: primase-helicase family protein [Patiriisocius sp.]
MLNLKPVAALLKANATVFYSDYGSKAVEESWTKRLNKKITSTEQVKEFTNLNIATGGESLIVDDDLDCTESNQLADHFLPPTDMEFGRESTPRAHRLYKVIDLTKKHTRSYFDFKGETKSMLVEMRANKHYTMCKGQYDNGEKVTWTKYGDPTEITWDALFKANALLSVASVLLRKAPPTGMRNEFWKLAIAVLWYHKVTEQDCINIVTAVATVADDDVNERLARVADIYKRDRSEQLLGLPTLQKEFNWTDSEAKEFKKLLLKITGRHLLPEYTNTFIDRIAYMMKQKKYYDLEDKEMYDAEAIDVKYSKFFDGKYTPLKYWKLHKDSKVCVDFTYKPNDPNRFVHVNKKLMINVYEKNELEPDSKVDTDIFWALLKHVIPHDDCREHFLNWYAFPIQNPGVKIRSAIIMQSDEFQLGKGSLFDLQRDILGMNNTRKIELAEALDKGKNYLLNYQTVLIDEAKSSGSWTEKAQLINTLKTIITEGSIGVRQLYKEYSEVDTCTNYWINTNYKDAFPLPKNEVRYFVYFSPAKRNQQMLDEFHLQRLNNNLAAGVMAELMDRDLSKFNPLAPAPWTTYRDQMSGMADRPLNDFIREQFEQGVHPFDRDMLSTVELFEYLKFEKRLRVTREREVANALELLGGKCRKQIPIDMVADRATVWILRNHDQYLDMPSADLGRKYVPFYSDIKKGG